MGDILWMYCTSISSRVTSSRLTCLFNPFCWPHRAFPRCRRAFRGRVASAAAPPTCPPAPGNDFARDMGAWSRQVRRGNARLELAKTGEGELAVVAR
eukprot:496371-Pyramimonas_sp.AAC.1